MSAYVGFSIGWIILIGLLSQGDVWALCMYMGSPFFGTFWSMCGVTDSGISPDPTKYWPATLSWTLALSVIAVILFVATLATFDRCLGRVARTAGRTITIPRTDPADETALSS